MKIKFNTNASDGITDYKKDQELEVTTEQYETVFKPVAEVIEADPVVVAPVAPPVEPDTPEEEATQVTGDIEDDDDIVEPDELGDVEDDEEE